MEPALSILAAEGGYYIKRSDGSAALWISLNGVDVVGKLSLSHLAMGNQ